MFAINPMQLMGMLVKGVNPKSMVINSLKNCNCPGFENLAEMIQNDDINGVEQLARNAAKAKGLNIDDMKNNLENQLKQFR